MKLEHVTKTVNTYKIELSQDEAELMRSFFGKLNLKIVQDIIVRDNENAQPTFALTSEIYYKLDIVNTERR